jgi:hypothetical protein
VKKLTNLLSEAVQAAQQSAWLHNAEDIIGIAALGAMADGLAQGLGPQALAAAGAVAALRAAMKLLPSAEASIDAATFARQTELVNALNLRVALLAAKLDAVVAAGTPLSPPTAR